MHKIPAKSSFENLQKLFDTQEPSRENAFDIRYYVELMLRYRWSLIIAPCIAMIAGIYLAVTLPKLYQADTLIFVEPQRVPDNYVQSIVSGDLGSRIDNLVHMIESRANLIEVSEKFELFSDPKFEKMFIGDRIQVMRQRTSVNLVRGNDRRTPANMFTISFKGEDPEKVMKVVNAMATLVINQNIKVRKSQASGTTKFLDEELGKMRKKLEEVETALAEYRNDNMGELPDQLSINLLILERLQQRIADKQWTLRNERNRLNSVENMLGIVRQQANSGGTTLSDGGESTTLKKLKLQLLDFQNRYTDKHPDVIGLREKIKDLERENIQFANEQGDQRRTGSRIRVNSIKGLSAVEADTIRSRENVRREIEAIKKEISELQTNSHIYRTQLENTPKREQDLLALNRDYENIKHTYNSLLERKLKADVAMNLEKRQQGEQFRIIDLARMPDKPISPDMKKLFLMFVLGGLFFGGGLIFLLQFFDNTVRKPESVYDRLGIPVLIGMPSLEQRKNVILRRINNVSSILGVMISLTLFACFAGVTILNMHQPIELIKNYINI